MRTALAWDVLFVIEHDESAASRDGEHYRLARQLRRTLITLDRDYLDDRKFPPERSGGVIVLMAPTQGGFNQLLKRLDREVLRVNEPAWSEHDADEPLPLAGPQASRARRLGRPVIACSGATWCCRTACSAKMHPHHRRRTHRGHRVRRRRYRSRHENDASDCYVVPGFVDVHVHGVEGFDTLDEGDAVA